MAATTVEPWTFYADAVGQRFAAVSFRIGPRHDRYQARRGATFSVAAMVPRDERVPALSGKVTMPPSGRTTQQVLPCARTRARSPVTAVMAMGQRNWWMPAFLSRSTVETAD
jgi:hypothetical protein